MASEDERKGDSGASCGVGGRGCGQGAGADRADEARADVKWTPSDEAVRVSHMAGFSQFAARKYGYVHVPVTVPVCCGPCLRA